MFIALARACVCGGGGGRGGSRFLGAGGGSNLPRGCSFSYFHLNFLKFLHENETIWFQRGVRVNPRTPSKSATWGYDPVSDLSVMHFRYDCLLNI